MNKTQWILCPVCGNKIRNRIREDTVLKNYPLYCPKCKQENPDRSGKLENNRYKETENLISICTPPCMGKTIAAVFLRLSAVSVKGFFAWLLLSTLFLQLSEPVSDALPFGWCAMRRIEYPLRKPALCATGIFRSQMPRAFTNRKRNL